VGLETLGVGKHTDGLGGLLLEAGRQCHVDDLAAVHAQQVVMVLGEVFGELEPGELVARRHPADKAGLMQVGQMPVGGAARQAGQSLGDVTNAHRVPGADEQVDDRAPTAGVALVDQAQPTLDDTVHVIGHLLSWHDAPYLAIHRGPASRSAEVTESVLVVVVAIGRVPVPVMYVIDVAAMRDRLVPAARAVCVDMARVCEMRQRMLVVMVAMGRVGMPFVHIVDMAFALGACVPAARPVSVVMKVNVMLLLCHDSSLL
jgi:hypothetical protein